MSLSKIELEILQKKRYVELESLGIDPEIYYLSVSTLNDYLTIEIGDLGDIQLKTKSVGQQTTFKNAADRLLNILNVPNLLASIIINEYLRDILIRHHLKRNPVENWDLLSSWDTLNKYEQVDDEYNF